MSWMRLDLRPDVAGLIKTSFEAAFVRGGEPRNAALFEVTAADGMQLYFSPGAAALFETNLRTLASKRAEAPPAGAVLKVGDPSFWRPT